MRGAVYTAAVLETRLRVLSYIVLGVVGGGLGAWGYWEWSESYDRLFHAIVIFAGGAIWFPFLATIAHVSLRGYYASIENSAVVVGTVQAHREDAEKILHQVKAIVETVERSVGHGNLDAALEAVKALPGKVDELKAAAVRGAVKGKL